MNPDRRYNYLGELKYSDEEGTGSISAYECRQCYSLVYNTDEHTKTCDRIMSVLK